jgi:hypothetical protein
MFLFPSYIDFFSFNRFVAVIDTPGHGDSQGCDELNREAFVLGMAAEKEIDAFVWVKVRFPSRKIGVLRLSRFS